LARLLDTVSKFVLFIFSVFSLKDESWQKANLHENWNIQTILEYLEYFCQMSPKLMFIISSYTISKLLHFFLRHSAEMYCICYLLVYWCDWCVCERSIAVEQVFSQFLVPYTLHCDERMKQLCAIYISIDSHSKRWSLLVQFFILYVTYHWAWIHCM